MLSIIVLVEYPSIVSLTPNIYKTCDFCCYEDVNEIQMFEFLQS